MRLASKIALCALACVTLSACAREKLDRHGKPIEIGRCRLHTYPAGARVWIDGKLEVEATPATLVLPAGEYHLRIQAPGAEALEHTLEIEAGESKDLTLNLPKAPEATIAIRSDVVGADVRINGYRRGATPLSPAVTKPGPVDITITSPNGRAKSVRTQLAIGEQKLLEVFFDDVMSTPETDEGPRLESRPEPRGYLTLGVKPDGVVLTAEEKRLGETPLMRLPLPTGEHELLLRSLDGRYEKRVIVELEADQTAVFRFQFRDEDQVPGWKPPPKDAGAAD